MVGLAFASLVTWTVFLAKSVEISSRAKTRAARPRAIAEARTLGEARDEIAAKIVACSRAFSMPPRTKSICPAAMRPTPSVMDRAGSRFSEIVRAEQRAVRRGMGALATIGSTAPFVGLFGTVWGIMNSFIGISKSQTTNLAVVAPGIAEALLATAIGLVAAIPAVIIYNHFTRATGAYLDVVNRASGASARLLSRDLDRGPARTLARAAE